MQRFVRKEEQKYPCLAGHRFFFLDWDLMLWRCHHWEEPMCSIHDFDESRLVRDGCTRCMINCYRDSSLMQHIAVSVHDGLQWAESTGALIAAFPRYHPRWAWWTNTVPGLREFVVSNQVLVLQP